MSEALCPVCGRWHEIRLAWGGLEVVACPSATQPDITQPGYFAVTSRLIRRETENGGRSVDDESPISDVSPTKP